MKDISHIGQPDSPLESSLIDVSLVRHYEDVAHLDNGETCFFSCTEGATALHFFGSHHRHDVDHPMFEELTRRAESAQPDLIFVEGMWWLRAGAPESVREGFFERSRATNLGEVVGRYGESGFMVRFALERGIRVECPEPEFASEFKYVEERGFSRDAIVGYYVYRMVNQWTISSAVTELESFLSPYIDELRSLSGWSDYDWSFEHIRSLSERFWGVPFTSSERGVYESGISPFTRRTTPGALDTNEVCAASGLFRDRVIAETIVAARTRARSIFVVYGSGHAFTLEPVLRSAFAV